MNILVVGGAGFIGHNVVQKFQSKNHTVSIIDSMTNYNTYEIALHDKKLNYRMSLMEDCKLYHCDISTSHLIMEQAFNEQHPDIVINLANVPVAGIAVKDPIMASDAMITGLLRLLKLSALFDVKRFVNISSSMVYGDFEVDPVHEDAVCNPLDIYGNLKFAGERLVRSYTRLHGLNHTIIRPSAVYGPTGNEMFVVTKFLRAAMSGGEINIMGSETALDFTYVSDITDGIYLAATNDVAANQTFNITAGRKRPLVDVANYFKNCYPDVTINITDPDPLYPKRGSLDIGKAKFLLGYSPKVDLETGLELFNSHMTTHEL